MPITPEAFTEPWPSLLIGGTSEPAARRGAPKTVATHPYLEALRNELRRSGE